MEHINKILSDLHENIENKGMFIPLCISNAIVAYKLAHNDEVYWLNFSKKACERKINTIKDLYMFYIDFLPQTSKFDKTFMNQVDNLKTFNSFLEEILYKQKFYYKNTDIFETHLLRGLEKIPNPMLPKFAKEIFLIAAEIKF